jgi:hypothetical protein
MPINTFAPVTSTWPVGAATRYSPTAGGRADRGGFAPAGASLGGGAAGSSIRSNSSGPLFRTLFTALLTGHRRSVPSGAEFVGICGGEVRCIGHARTPPGRREHSKNAPEVIQ